MSPVQLDMYCERFGFGLWSEPLNAVTSLAFLVSALAIWNLDGNGAAGGRDHRILVALTTGIGIGSGLFHTFGAIWAWVLDVAFILIFQLSLVWLYCGEVLRIRLALRVGVILLLLAVILYGMQFPDLIGGSLPYVPAALTLLVLGLTHHLRGFNGDSILLAASGIFLVALVFRSVDDILCPAIPIGTHFLWHLLNAAVLYLVSQAYLSNLPARYRMVG